MDVPRFFVLLTTFSYFSLSLAYGYEFLNHGGHKTPTEQHQADAVSDAKKIDNNPVKPETKMETKDLNNETAEGQSKPATITAAKSTSEVHA